MVTKQDIPEVAEFMSDIWTYIKTYWDVINTDEWWQSLINNGNAIADKYRSVPFAVDWIIAFMNSKEQEIKTVNRKEIT